MDSESEYYTNLVSHYHTYDLEVILFSPTVANKDPVPDDFISDILKYAFQNDFQRDSISYIAYNTAVIDNHDYYLRMIYSYWIFDPPSVDTSKYNVLARAVRNKITNDSHNLHRLRQQFVFNGCEMGNPNENFLIEQLKVYIESHNITKQIVYTRDMILDEDEYYYYKLIGKNIKPDDLSVLIHGATVAPNWRVPDKFIARILNHRHHSKYILSTFNVAPNTEYYLRMMYSYWVFDPPEHHSYKYYVLSRAIRAQCHKYGCDKSNNNYTFLYGKNHEDCFDGADRLKPEFINNNQLTFQLQDWLSNKNIVRI